MLTCGYGLMMSMIRPGPPFFPPLHRPKSGAATGFRNTSYGSRRRLVKVFSVCGGSQKFLPAPAQFGRSQLGHKSLLWVSAAPFSFCASISPAQTARAHAQSSAMKTIFALSAANSSGQFQLAIRDDSGQGFPMSPCKLRAVLGCYAKPRRKEHAPSGDSAQRPRRGDAAGFESAWVVTKDSRRCFFLLYRKEVTRSMEKNVLKFQKQPVHTPMPHRS